MENIKKELRTFVHSEAGDGFTIEIVNNRYIYLTSGSESFLLGTVRGSQTYPDMKEIKKLICLCVSVFFDV